MLATASVGGLAVLAVVCVILFAVFGSKILKTMIRVAAFVLLAYLIILWMPFWMPYARPIIEQLRAVWDQAMAGPNG